MLLCACSLFVGCSNNVNNDRVLNTQAGNKQVTDIVKTTKSKKKKSPAPVNYRLVKRTVLQDAGVDHYESIEVIVVEGHTIISHKWKRGYAGGIADTHISDCYGCNPH